jgi:hypothetical protein
MGETLPGGAAPVWVGGAYVNFMIDSEGENCIRATCGDKYERLTGIKAKYGPEKFFR